MKLNVKQLAMAAFALLAMNSCTQEDEIITGGETKGTPVNFEFGIGSVTRTIMDDSYNTTFEENDAVGIFQVDENGVVVANAKYVLNSEGNWAAEGTAIYALEGSQYSYYAYYPYQENATSYTAVPFTVAADQSTGFEDNDALTASNTTVTAGSDAISLTFNHAYSLIQVNLSGTEATEDAVVTLKNIYPTADLNLSTGQATAASGTATDVIMWQHGTQTGVYRAIVPVQTIAQGNVLLEIAAAKNYRFTWNQAVEYPAGSLRVINVTLGETPEQTTITIPASDVDIDTWGNAGEAEGEGEVEEIKEYVTTPFTLDFSSLTTESFTNIYGANVEITPGETVAWYHRETAEENAITTVEVENGAIKLTCPNTTSTSSTRGSWNNSHIVCHYPGLFDKAAMYSITITATNDVNAELQNGVVGFTIGNSNNTKRFKLLSAATGSTWDRNVTTFNNLTSTPRTFYIDFTQVSTAGSSGASMPAEQPFESSTDEDVSNGINIVFYNYAQDASPIIISNVTIDKVEAEEASN